MRASLKNSLLTVLALLLYGSTPAFAQMRDNGFLVDVPPANRQSSFAPARPAPTPRVETVPAAEPQRAREPEVPATREVAPKPREEADNAVVVPLATDGRGPDESALRYYASLQQTKRVETEMKRLQRLYPDWRPPENIYNTPAAGSVDEQPFWDLYALDKMDELRADIEKRMKKEPGWQPSADLMDKIRRKESRLSITSLWKSGNWKDLIAYVQNNKQAIASDTDIDLLWTVAEAFAKTKQTSDAVDFYKSILSTNREAPLRVATIQKAMSVLRMSDVEELLAMARTDATGFNEFGGLWLDITRGRISAFLHDERKEPIAESDLRTFEQYAKAEKDPNQPGLVAWYYYKTKSYSQALEWFKHSISRGGDPMIAHGLAHSLRELGLYRETEEVAYAWREPLVNNAILFIDILERDLTKPVPPFIEPERLLRYAQVTMDGASGEGAQALAWYAYNSCQYNVALEWFERAVAWLPKEATVYGYALTLQKVKKTKEFWDTMNRYDGLFPKVIELIYPDDTPQPPTPCELVERNSQPRPAGQHRQAFVAPNPQGFTVPSPYAAPPAAPGAARPSSGYGAVPAARMAVPAQPRTVAGPPAVATPFAPPQPGYYQQPGIPGVAGYYQNPALAHRREPVVDRKLFPVSVDPQNPLRFYPTGRYMGQPAPAAAQNLATQSPLVNEPPMTMLQLVARRVPDVTRMPYERWGYALLPGYNGIAVATGPHSAEKAPAETLWATQQSKDAASTRGAGFDPIRNDIGALLQRMAALPRVPPPAASVTGPWRSQPPYKSREQLEAEGLLPVQNEVAGPADIVKPAAPVATLAPVNTGPRRPGETLAGANPAMLSPRSPAPAHQTEIVPPKDKVENNSRDTLGRQATEFYNRKLYAEALDALDRRAKTAPEPTDLRLIRAWSLLNLNKVEEAKQVFSTLSGTGKQRANSEQGNTRTR